MTDLTFREAFCKTLAYQNRMGYVYTEMAKEEKLNHLRNYTVALMMEQAELLKEVSWKPWRPLEAQKPKPNKRKISLEWIDCFIFLLDQAYCLDLSVEDIQDAFTTKTANNLARISSGYSKLLKRGDAK